MLPSFFVHHISKLENIVSSLGLDPYVEDELTMTDFEELLLSQDITFAVLLDEQVGIYYTLRELSEATDERTDDLCVCQVDSLTLALFDGKTHVFVFVKTRHRENAEDLLNSIL